MTIAVILNVASQLFWSQSSIMRNTFLRHRTPTCPNIFILDFFESTFVVLYFFFIFAFCFEIMVSFNLQILKGPALFYCTNDNLNIKHFRTNEFKMFERSLARSSNLCACFCASAADYENKTVLQV